MANKDSEGSKDSDIYGLMKDRGYGMINFYSINSYTVAHAVPLIPPEIYLHAEG